jgi:hypothetical protein
VIGILGAVAGIEIYQSRQIAQLELAAKRASGSDVGSSRTAVVYFSRSGNTGLAARHIASRLNAETIQLRAPAYELGPVGLANALKDANNLKTDPMALPEVIPAITDFSGVDTIWIGSPVWLYSPAPPIWAFVEHNRFDGAHVVLFNTFNSHFGDDHIERLRAKVLVRGATSFEHRAVKRGRMTQQMTPEEMLRIIDDEWF